MSTLLLITDSSTLVLNGHVFTDFVDGDTITLTSPNELTSRTRSTKSVNIQKRSDSDVLDALFNVPKYSDDDIWLNSQRNQETPVIFKGSVKESYTKDGIEHITTYTLEDGSFTVQPTDTKNNQDGNNLMAYTIQFNKARRV